MFENQNVDNIGQVAEGTVERAGLNILGLVTSLANQQLDTEIRSEVIAIMVMVIGYEQEEDAHRDNEEKNKIFRLSSSTYLDSSCSNTHP